MESNSPIINILLVDDNESNLLALESILSSPDRNLVRAASGDEALHYLLYNDVAVILLDVHMPGITGLETAELIRGRKKSRDVPIIFLTAYDRGDEKQFSEGYSLGAVDYIIKPLNPDALRSKVAVFAELFKKQEEVKHQSALLREKNIQLENSNFRRLGKLVELGQRLTAERDPEQLLQVFCDAARDIVGARSSFVRILEAPGQPARHMVQSGPGDSGLAIEEVRKIDGGIQKGTSLNGKPGRWSRSDNTAQSDRFSFDSLLACPISLPAQMVGWLYLVDKLDADEFSEADERLAMTLTGQLAVAYENARLYAEAQRHADELREEVKERKHAQEQKEALLLSEQAARLEAEDAQRLSAELLVREKEARAEAEAANRLKDEFLATVSHELRTPLNSILGWAQLMRTGALDESSSNRALHTIERNTKSLAQIIDDLLDVSRIITGKLRLDVRPMELAPVVAAALEAIQPATDAKNIRLEVSLDPSVGVISGDPNRLQQVVWNLLTNAIKFTPQEGEVKVTLERVDGNACITVSDNGEGISEDFLPHIFDRFRQADSTFTRMHGGLGLGLAIVRHLVEMHGGTVSAASPGRGKGSTFAVSFPVTALRWSGREAENRADDNSRSLEEPHDLADLRVLIVDDELDARELLVAMLERHGAEVIAVCSAADALAVLGASSDFAPDVLISDIGMPGEDGIDLITKVRKMSPDHGGRIPAIALTAYARAEDRARVLAAGFQRHVTKPVEPSQLAFTVADLARRAARV